MRFDHVTRVLLLLCFACLGLKCFLTKHIEKTSTLLQQQEILFGQLQLNKQWERLLSPIEKRLKCEVDDVIRKKTSKQLDIILSQDSMAIAQLYGDQMHINSKLSPLDQYPSNYQLDIARTTLLQALLDANPTNDPHSWKLNFRPFFIIENIYEINNQCTIEGIVFSNFDARGLGSESTLIINDIRIENPTFPFLYAEKIESAVFEIKNPVTLEIKKYKLYQ